MQELTDSTLAVGLISLFEGLTIIGLSPIGGSVVDRLHRRRVLQAAQALSLVASLILAALTFAHLITPAWIYIAATLVAAAATFDTPARQSLVAAVVPRERLVDAFSLIIPGLQLARLLGPALAGVLIALWGPAAVYIFDAATYAVLIVTLPFIPFGERPLVKPQELWSDVSAGFRYVRSRAVIWQMMALDLGVTLFAGFRVLLPAIARDVFVVGPVGYGLLAAAPSVGALFGAATVYRSRAFTKRGRLAILAATGYAIFAMALGHVPAFGLAMICATGIGYFDVMGATIRHATLQGETPDYLRGRVSATYYMFARGGDALGQAQLGALASVTGPSLALTLGAVIALLSTAAIAFWGKAVVRYDSSAPVDLSPAHLAAADPTNSK